MKCLLCGCDDQHLRYVGPDLWALECVHCCEYRFSGPVARCVQRARAHGERAVLQQLPELAELSHRAREAGTVLTIAVTGESVARSGTTLQGDLRGSGPAAIPHESCGR